MISSFCIIWTQVTLASWYTFCPPIFCAFSCGLFLLPTLLPNCDNLIAKGCPTYNNVWSIWFPMYHQSQVHLAAIILYVVISHKLDLLDAVLNVKDFPSSTKCRHPSLNLSKQANISDQNLQGRHKFAPSSGCTLTQHLLRLGGLRLS